MAGRRCDVLDVREMLRRLRLGQTRRTVAKELGVSRNTVRDYTEWFEREGLLAPDTPLPSAQELGERLGEVRASVPVIAPRLLPYRDEIATLVTLGLDVTVAWRRFSDAHPGARVSYQVFRRFVRRHVESKAPRAFLRIEVEPGAEAQVDFGFAGYLPRAIGEPPRKTWVFVMTLSHSRHQYVELVHDQSVTTWLMLHRHAFAFFAGVPHKIVLDNLKAGIVKASVTDPEVQRAYCECAEHYGFLISPCVPRTPEHKGKVESGVKYLRRSFLAGRIFLSLEEANAAALHWVLEVAGERVHGTTREVPLDVFAARERAALRPLPDAPFELVEYKQVRLHPDCHVVFNGSYYSASYRLIGKRLWLRATTQVAQLFHEHQLIRTHRRSHRPGERITNEADLPPEKARYYMESPSWCRQRAAEIGANVADFIGRLLSDRVLDRLRGAQATLRLADRFGAQRLDAACRRAVACDAIVARTVKSILARGLDAEPLPGEPAPPPTPAVRPAHARTFFDLFDNPNAQGDDPWTSSTN